MTFRVLAVDDEPMLRAGESRILRDYKVDVPEFDESVGFEMSEAPTGEDALAFYESSSADIMLLDLGLPGIQGMDVLQKVIADSRDVIPIVVTAYASIETAVAATKLGAFDFLVKPFTPDELRNCVSKATRHLFAARQAKKLEQERHQQRFQLISIVSHELKSPLAVVESYLKVLSDPEIEKTPEMIDRVVERMSVRVEGMRKLIIDLLDLTRIESGQKKRDIQTVDISECARRSVENVAHDAEARSISLNVNIPEGTKISGDPGEIDIILNNLMTNAVKYNRDGGSVFLDAKVNDNVLTMSVRDTGIGISKEESERLFREFSRIRNQKTAKIPGSGLGLSILKRLAKLYDGDVSVESEPNVGSTFTVTLKTDTVPAV